MNLNTLLQDDATPEQIASWIFYFADYAMLRSFYDMDEDELDGLHPTVAEAVEILQRDYSLDADFTIDLNASEFIDALLDAATEDTGDFLVYAADEDVNFEYVRVNGTPLDVYLNDFVYVEGETEMTETTVIRTEAELEAAIASALTDIVEGEPEMTDMIAVPTRPVYNCTRKSYSNDRQSWQPRLTPDEVLNIALPDLSGLLRTRKAPKRDAVIVRQDELYALGRALAQKAFWAVRGVSKDGKGIVLAHKHEDRLIKVWVENELAKVEEATKDRKGVWQTREHALSQKVAEGLQLVTLQEPAEKKIGVWMVIGHTARYYAKDLEAAGGIKGKSYHNGVAVEGYKFVREVPEIARQIVAKSQKNTIEYNAYGLRLSKYHVLEMLLRENAPVFVLDKGMDMREAQFDVWDAFTREMWRLAGFDYREFPARERQAEMVF